MTTQKSERLLNLLITLLVTRHYVSKERIRAVVPGYAEDTEAGFEKKFERDKDELRSLGVPIEVGTFDPLFDDEPGYRIRPDEFALPEVELTADEAAVVGLAARVWENAGLASATSDALLKLRAAGVDVDRSGLDVVQPRVAGDEPSFGVVWDATRSRTRLRFDYRSGAAGAVATRTVEPWGVVGARGRWYLVARDVDREASRVFRLSRVDGVVRTVGRSGAFEVPAGTDVRRLAAGVIREAVPVPVTLRVREGRGHGLRRRASTTRPAEGAAGWDVLDLELGDLPATADEVLGYGSDVVVLDPPELRETVRGRLAALAGGGVA